MIFHFFKFRLKSLDFLNCRKMNISCFIRTVIIIISILDELMAKKKKTIITSNFCRIDSTKNFSNAQNECHNMVQYFSCTKDICATNKSECDAYLFVEIYTSFHKNRSKLLRIHGIRKFSNNQTDLFITFNRNIKKCIQKTHVWKSDDVCMKRKKCYISLNETAKKYKKTHCPCNGHHFYECKTDYCATSQAACDTFSDRTEKSNEIVTSTRTCPFLHNPF